MALHINLTHCVGFTLEFVVKRNVRYAQQNIRNVKQEVANCHGIQPHIYMCKYNSLYRYINLLNGTHIIYL